MNNITRNSLIFVLLLLLATPLASFAAGPTQSPFVLNERALPYGPGSILGIIEMIADWVFTILLVVAVIFLLIAAFNYMGGTEEGVQKAHRMLLYTAVAVAVAMLSVGITTAVIQLIETRR